MSRLLTPADLAERWSTTSRWVMENYAQWPHVRLGRRVRFTEAQVAEIERRNTVAHRPAATGQTGRSRTA